MKDLIKVAIVLTIGGTVYSVSQADLVQNFSNDTGMSKEAAQKYVEDVSQEDLVPFTEVGEEFIQGGQESLKAATEIDCLSYEYEWESETLTCSEGKSQLKKIGNDSVALGEAYKTLDEDTATSEDISTVIRLIDVMNGNYSLEIITSIIDAETIEEGKKTNSYNKALLQSALDSNWHLKIYRAPELKFLSNRTHVLFSYPHVHKQTFAILSLWTRLSTTKKWRCGFCYSSLIGNWTMGLCYSIQIYSSSYNKNFLYSSCLLSSSYVYTLHLDQLDMNIKRVVTCLPTKDPQRSLDFYQNCLGFTSVIDGNIVTVETANLDLFLIEEKEFAEYLTAANQSAYFPEHAAQLIFSLAVERREEIENVLRQTTEYKGKVVQTLKVNKWQQEVCYIQDPDGHLFEIVLLKSATTAR